MTAPTMLLILDGFGHSETLEGNALPRQISRTLTAVAAILPRLFVCFGPSSGFTPGANRQSEVGHMNMGAGRVVYQDLTRITKGIEEGDFFENQVLLATMIM